MPDVVLTDLARMAPFIIRAAGDSDSEAGDGFTLDGYGAVFDAETLIDSWEGTFRESIAQGSFKKSLRERTPRMQFDHGRHPLIGSIPIGTFEAGYPQEDTNGLHVVGRLADNWLVQPVREAIASGAIDGMSFRFSVVRESWTRADGRRVTNPAEIADLIWSPPEDGPLLRTIQEVKLSEVGPVVWPAYEQTSVGMRGGVIDLARLNEPGMRRLLAEAVYTVDVAEGQRQGNAARPQSSVNAPDRHANNAPVISADTPGEHRQPTRKDDSPAIRADISRWLGSRRVVIENLYKNGS